MRSGFRRSERLPEQQPKGRIAVQAKFKLHPAIGKYRLWRATARLHASREEDIPVIVPTGRGSATCAARNSGPIDVTTCRRQSVSTDSEQRS